MKYQFPKNFKWGSAVWALGVEGALDKREPTCLDEFYRLQPERFYNQVGPGKTLNWYEDYAKYVDLAADLKHNSFRTSIMWARLIKQDGTVNQEAVEFYRNYFKAFKDKDKDIELSVVLYWFDMPLYLENRGGFTNREVIDLFRDYCGICFDLFDDLVDIWYVYNEPIIDVQMKYQWDTSYPNKIDFTLAS